MHTGILPCPTCWLGTLIHTRQMPKLTLENLESRCHLLGKWGNVANDFTDQISSFNNPNMKPPCMEISSLKPIWNPKCNLVAAIMPSKLPGGGLAADCMAKVPRPDSKDVQVLTFGSPDMCRQHLSSNYLSKIWGWLVRIIQNVHLHGWSEYPPWALDCSITAWAKL